MVALLTALQNLATNDFSFLFHGLYGGLHLGLVELGHMLVGVNHFVEVTILLFKFICLLIQLVHVSKKTVILLLRLDERCHDLVDVRYPSRVLDGFKCFFNDAGIADVLVKELLLFCVLALYLVKPNF